jgi:hypothetical protein
MPTLTQRILYTLIYLYIPHSILLLSLIKFTFYLFVLCSHSFSLVCLSAPSSCIQLTVVFLAAHHSQLSSLLLITGPALTLTQPQRGLTIVAQHCLCRTAPLAYVLAHSFIVLDCQPFLLCIGPGLSTNTVRLRGRFVNHPNPWVEYMLEVS